LDPKKKKVRSEKNSGKVRGRGGWERKRDGVKQEGGREGGSIKT